MSKDKEMKLSALDAEICTLIKAAKSKEDTTTFMYMSGKFDTKSAARAAVEKVIEDNDLTIVKEKSKSDGLKEWFLSQDDPMAVTAVDIKKQCLALSMKGGSVQYYVNAYKLAVDLASRITDV